jgi:3',5'-cyclic AMP phosphodiesterase CpdA
MLQQLGAGTLLTLGLWPGALRADNEMPSGSFRFIVINDTHCMSRACGEYLQAVVTRLKKEQAEFTLHAGDLTDQAERELFVTVKETFAVLPGPFYPTPGNHDHLTDRDRSSYEKIFPRRINYSFKHRGWQFIVVDSTDGLRYENTLIQRPTLRWLDETLPKLNGRRPTVLLTHFPLGVGVSYRPLNADALLDRFLDFNLQAVFSGHYHGFTERVSAGVTLTTNRCCSLKRGNHDGTKEKGYFLCSAQDGRIVRSFVEHRNS